MPATQCTAPPGTLKQTRVTPPLYRRLAVRGGVCAACAGVPRLPQCHRVLSRLPPPGLPSPVLALCVPLAGLHIQRALGRAFSLLIRYHLTLTTHHCNRATPSLLPAAFLTHFPTPTSVRLLYCDSAGGFAAACRASTSPPLCQPLATKCRR